jgi:hypothetical protein
MFLSLSGTTDPWRIPENVVEHLPELFKLTEAPRPNQSSIQSLNNYKNKHDITNVQVL